jgi:ASC-1-like (ASCH) protein
MQKKHFIENNENSGPRIKNKKNIENENENDENDDDSDLFGPIIKNSGPRIKNKKDDKNSGPRIKNSGPRIKNKKDDDENSGPRIKNKKDNNENSGPRIKNKKDNNENSGPRIKNKKDNNNGNNGNHQSREFEMTIREPWFSLIENGQKQVEGRLYRGIVEEFRVNDTIRFINKWNGIEKSVIVKITKLTKYPNFGDLLFNEKLHRVLPGLPNIKCGILVYNKIYANFNEIKEFGTLAIELEVV